MNIEGKKFANQSVNFFNQSVEFDSKGIAEVSEELGNQIIKEFSDLVNIPGQKKEIKNIPSADSIELTSIKEELNRVVRVKEGVEKQLVESKEQEKIWRSECLKYEKFLKDKGLVLEKEISHIENKPNSDEIDIPDGFEEIYKEMETKNLSDLKKMCKQDLDVSDEILDKFKGKEAKKELIKYVFENVVNN